MCHEPVNPGWGQIVPVNPYYRNVFSYAIGVERINQRFTFEKFGAGVRLLAGASTLPGCRGFRILPLELVNE